MIAKDFDKGAVVYIFKFFEFWEFLAKAKTYLNMKAILTAGQIFSRNLPSNSCVVPEGHCAYSVQAENRLRMLTTEAIRM